MALDVAGSNPVAHPELILNKRPLRLVVRTQDFHSCNRGSIPLGDAKSRHKTYAGFFFK